MALSLSCDIESDVIFLLGMATGGMLCVHLSAVLYSTPGVASAVMYMATSIFVRLSPVDQIEMYRYSKMWHACSI